MILSGPLTKHETHDVGVATVVGGVCVDGGEGSACCGAWRFIVPYWIFFHVRLLVPLYLSFWLYLAEPISFVCGIPLT